MIWGLSGNTVASRHPLLNSAQLHVSSPVNSLSGCHGSSGTCLVPDHHPFPRTSFLIKWPKVKVMGTIFLQPSAGLTAGILLSWGRGSVSPRWVCMCCGVFLVLEGKSETWTDRFQIPQTDDIFSSHLPNAQINFSAVFYHVSPVLVNKHGSAVITLHKNEPNMSKENLTFYKIVEEKPVKNTVSKTLFTFNVSLGEIMRVSLYCSHMWWTTTWQMDATQASHQPSVTAS